MVVALTKVDGTLVPFTCTDKPFWKPEPVNVTAASSVPRVRDAGVARSDRSGEIDA